MDSDVVDSETRVLNLSKGNYDGMRHELAMTGLGNITERKDSGQAVAGI